MNERCGGRCICKCIFCFVFTALFIFILALFIFLLIFLPSEVKFHVTEASLTQFNFTTTNNTLDYNLAINITLRNPNKRVGVYYDRIEAIAYFRKKMLSTVSLSPFYIGHKNTTILRPIFEGQRVILLGDRDLSELESEKSGGVYKIDIKIAVQIRSRYGKIKSLKVKPSKIDCPLKVPLSTNNGTVAQAFKTTKCRSSYFVPLASSGRY